MNIRGSASPSRRWSQARTLFYHGLLITFGFLMIYPLLWLFASSFKETSDIWTNMSSLIPQKFTLEHYVNGWQGFGGITLQHITAIPFF
jgi:multiple sugar transport system permease protein